MNNNMKNILKTSAVSIVTLGMAFSVFAQSPTPTLTPTPTRIPTREQVRDIRDARKEGMRDIKEIRRTTKEEMGNLRREFQDKIRDARKVLKDQIEAKREQLKQDLHKIKDERKKSVVERVDKAMDALNQKVTNHFLNVLEKLEDVLARIQSRTDEVANRGVDVSDVNSAIETAQTAIGEARAAVEVQAGKTYFVEVNTDATLKPDVGKARQALHADLKTVFGKVKVAKEAVHKAARALAGLIVTPVPSPSVSVSPTVSPTETSTP